MARILMIEDTEHNLELMTYLLTADGHSVTSASTGRAGLALAARHEHDLVVLDLQLPDTSGYDLLAAFRADAALAAVPVVAVTANAMVGDRDAVLAAGFDGYVPKPIEPRTFSTEISSYLPAQLRGRDPKSA